MKKLRLTLFIIALLFSLSLSAEITKEQADTVVLEYIQNEVTWSYVLVRNENPPSEDGKTSVTWNNRFLHAESLCIEYPCWVYSVYNPTVDDPYTILFLFIGKENGNLLEVKSKQAYGADVRNWTVITTKTDINEIGDVNKSENVVISPNPVSDYLNITSDTGISRIEIYDSSGRIQLAEPVQSDTNYRLNLSSLPRGWYLLKIVDATGKKIKEHKLIKN
jgi:hypothetical protein